MNQKHQQSIYHANVNLNLIVVEILIQIENGTMINVNVSERNIMCTKKIIFGILLHAVATMINI